MNYLLMNKDNVVAEIIPDGVGYGEPAYVLGKVSGKLPYGLKDVNDWLESRVLGNNREHMSKLLRRCNKYGVEQSIEHLHCASVTDTFWVKREDDSSHWEDASLFRLKYDVNVSRISYTAEETNLCEIGISPDFSMDGSYDKCCIRMGDSLHIIKRGISGYANSGLEPYGECFTYPIYKAIVGDAVEYSVRLYEGFMASDCALFTSENVGFSPVSKLSTEHNIHGLLSYYQSIGQEDKFKAMLVADAVCFNSDRHAGNHGVIFNTETLEILGMAPMFDHNLALLPYAMESDFADIEDYISLQGPKIGDMWVDTARAVLTEETRERLMSLSGYVIPFAGDERFPKKRVDFMNDLINRQIDRILK